MHLKSLNIVFDRSKKIFFTFSKLLRFTFILFYFFILYSFDILLLLYKSAYCYFKVFLL